MTSAELSRRVAKVVGYPPLCEMSDLQRREFHDALLEADTFEDLPGKWQAAILKAEQTRPKLRVCQRRLSQPAAGGRGRRRAAAIRPTAEADRVPARVPSSRESSSAGLHAMCRLLESFGADGR
jgi:hypothetical protein